MLHYADCKRALEAPEVPFTAKEFFVDASKPFAILMARSVYSVVPIEIQRNKQPDILATEPRRKSSSQLFAV
jgi:hypothetical protein